VLVESVRIIYLGRYAFVNNLLLHLLDCHAYQKKVNEMRSKLILNRHVPGGLLIMKKGSPIFPYTTSSSKYLASYFESVSGIYQKKKKNAHLSLQHTVEFARDYKHS
jgi:hypothetical protein